jgi:hypothetical protein
MPGTRFATVLAEVTMLRFSVSSPLSRVTPPQIRYATRARCIIHPWPPVNAASHRIAPQPLRWLPLARKSGTHSDRYRQTPGFRSLDHALDRFNGANVGDVLVGVDDAVDGAHVGSQARVRVFPRAAVNPPAFFGSRVNVPSS